MPGYRTPQFLTYPHLLGFFEGLPIPADYIFNQYFPVERIATDEALLTRGVAENPMASFTALDAEVDRAANELTYQELTEVAFIRQKQIFEETNFRYFQQVASSQDRVMRSLQQEAENKMTRTMGKLRGSVDTRIEWALFNALAGRISYNDGKINIDIPFDGVNKNADVTNFSGGWGAGATGTPVSDLQSAIAKIEEESGVTPTTMIMSSRVAGVLAENDQIANLWSNLSGAGGVYANDSLAIGRNMVAGVINASTQLNIVIYNARTTSRTYLSTSDGSDPTVARSRIMPDDKILLMPPNPVGQLLVSPGPPILGDTTVRNGDGGLYIWRWQSPKPPLDYEVGVGFNCFPNFLYQEQVGYFDVL